MAAKGAEPKHHGALIRGATGDLWFLRDDSELPVRVEDMITNRDVWKRLNDLLPKGPEEQLLTVGLPQEVNDILEDIFGPLFWCIGFLTAQRLKR
jgi:hypothetical protein